MSGNVTEREESLHRSFRGFGKFGQFGSFGNHLVDGGFRHLFDFLLGEHTVGGLGGTPPLYAFFLRVNIICSNFQLLFE